MASLPKPEWISLSAAWDEAVAAFPKDAAGEIESALLSAFADGKIHAQGRCRSYYEHDTIVRLDRHSWDLSRLVPAWDENAFRIVNFHPYERVHVFTDILVDRRGLERWCHSHEKPAQMVSPATDRVAAERSPSFSGRPSIMSAIKSEIARLAADPSGLRFRSKKDAAMHLADWAKNEISGQQTPTFKTVLNALSKEIDSLVQRRDPQAS